MSSYARNASLNKDPQLKKFYKEKFFVENVVERLSEFQEKLNNDLKW